jgi:hypothetical protein
MSGFRQKLLVLYLGSSTPQSEVIGWSLYDGSSNEVFEATNTKAPPYVTCLDAMRDGWRVIRFPVLQNVVKGSEFDLGYLEHEFILEKWEAKNG